MTPNMCIDKGAYVVEYPWALDAAEQQQDISWTPKEIDVSKDIQDILVNMTEAESYGVKYQLKLFTLYERMAGTSYWGKRVVEMFPKPACIERMATQFAQTENCVHAPFYNNLNAALNLDTEEFYLSYKQDPVLSSRMQFIGEAIANSDPLVSMGAFSMVEGTILYTTFAYLLHFQSAGKNKLKNVCSGVKFSVRDENLHSEAGALMYKTYLHESLRKPPTLELIKVARTIIEHEDAIIDHVFSKGEIEGINARQLKVFARHRVNLCLNQLGIPSEFDESNNVIKEWFYDGINAVQLHDFFVGVGNEYNRDWAEKKFTW
tara:strand:+ start:189 stop:1145 length:957 start_codon:yes stop_codon:yes gene_type:complete